MHNCIIEHFGGRKLCQIVSILFLKRCLLLLLLLFLFLPTPPQSDIQTVMPT